MLSLILCLAAGIAIGLCVAAYAKKHPESDTQKLFTDNDYVKDNVQAMKSRFQDTFHKDKK